MSKSVEKKKPFALYCEGPGRTKKNFAPECDINNILQKYSTGVLPVGNKVLPKFDDVSNVPDYQQALNAVNDAQARFAALPSNVRSRFENNPALFLAFASDSKNREEMEKMGLLTPKAKEEPKAPTEPAAPPVAG